MMNPEIKAEWVDALRSGEYRQGRSYLTQITPRGRRYSPLGVLCDLALGNDVPLGYREVRYGSDLVLAFSDRYGSGDFIIKFVLPLAVRDWAALRSDLPSLRVNDAERDLLSCNDGAGARFPAMGFGAIAALIDSQL